MTRVDLMIICGGLICLFVALMDIEYIPGALAGSAVLLTIAVLARD